MDVARMIRRLVFALLGALSIVLAAASARAADTQPDAPTQQHQVQPTGDDTTPPPPPEVPATP